MSAPGWYSTGTVTVENGSDLVIGSGTAWLALSGPGVANAFVGPDGMVYGVASIQADGALRLGRVYRGVSASGQTYDIYPTQGLTRQLSTDVQELVDRSGATLDEIATAADAAVSAAVVEQVNPALAAVQTAADAALIQAGVYATEAAGRAAVADGQAFKVEGAGDVAAYEYRRVNSSTSTLIATYPSSSAVAGKASKADLAPLTAALPDFIPLLPGGTDVAVFADDQGVMPMVFSPSGVARVAGVESSRPIDIGLARFEFGFGLAMAIVDLDDKVSFATFPDGTTTADAVTVEDGAGTPIVIGGASIATGFGLSLAVVDPDDKVAFAVFPDGTTTAGSGSGSVNYAAPDMAKPGSNFVADHNIITMEGQSLQVRGASGAIVDTTDEFVNTGRTAFVPIANDGYYGASLAAIQQLKFTLAGDTSRQIVKAPYYSNDYKVCAVRRALSGTGIAGLNKGTATYNDMVADVTAARDLAGTANQSAAVQAALWYQGEADQANTGYQAALIQLKNDRNTDLLALTKQPNRIPMLITQLAGSNNSGVPVVAAAQLAAALADPEIVLVGPMYYIPYEDAVHPTDLGARWFGQMVGKVLHRVVYRGEVWEPLRPLSAKVYGANNIIVRLKVPFGPVVLDTTTVPASTDYGFVVRDGSGVVPISSIAVVGGSAVRLALGRPLSGSATIEYAWRDHPTDGGNGNYAGNGVHAIRGNFRDSDPTVAAYGSSFPLWNWLVRFSIAVTP